MRNNETLAKIEIDTIRVSLQAGTQGVNVLHVDTRSDDVIVSCSPIQDDGTALITQWTYDRDGKVRSVVALDLHRDTLRDFAIEAMQHIEEFDSKQEG